MLLGIILASGYYVQMYEEPLSKANPNLNTLLNYLAVPAGLAILVGMVIIFVPPASRNVIVNGTVLTGVKAFVSKYKAATADVLFEEIIQKLTALRFEAAEKQGGYICGTQAFYFAKETDLDSIKNLSIQIQELLEEITGENPGLIVFFSFPYVTDEHLLKLKEIQTDFLSFNIDMQVCFYDLSDRNSYLIINEKNNRAAVMSLVTGINKLDIISMLRRKFSKTNNEEPEGK